MDVAGVMELIKSGGPAYVLAGVLFFLMIWDRRAFADRARARDAKADALADKLYEVALAGVQKDTEVLSALTEIRRDFERTATGGKR